MNLFENIEIRDKDFRLLYRGQYSEAILYWTASTVNKEWFNKEFPLIDFDKYRLEFDSNNMPLKLIYILEYY